MRKELIYIENLNCDSKTKKCKQLSNDILFKKYNIVENDIIEIRESQCICMIENGNLCDIKDKVGCYEIVETNKNENNNLIISKATNEKLCILYLNKNLIKYNKLLFSKKINQQNIILECRYEFQIVEIINFLSKLIGIPQIYPKQELIERVRKFIFESIENNINIILEKYKIDTEEIENYLQELEELMCNITNNAKLLQYGITITSFNIINFRINERKNIFFRNIY